MSLPQDQQRESEKAEETSDFLNVEQSICDENQQKKKTKINIEKRQNLAKKFQEYREKRPPVLSGSIKVTVSSNPTAIREIIKINTTENEEVVSFKVKNVGGKRVLLTLKNYEFVKNIFTISDKNGSLIESIKQHLLKSEESLELFVHISSSHAGFYEQLLVFKFETDNGSDQLKMMCLLEVTFQTLGSKNHAPAEESSQWKPQPVRVSPLDNIGDVLLKEVFTLWTYAVPGNLDIKGSERALLIQPLTWENYAWRFHQLLYLEELVVRTEFEKFSQEEVPVIADETQQDILILKISDIIDSSAVQSGNQVRVTPIKQSTEETAYEGCVYSIDEEQIYLMFATKLPEVFKEEVMCRVAFSHCRIPVRMQHRAAALVYKYNLEKFLFPGEWFFPRSPSPNRSVSITPIPEMNEEQNNAIQHILACSARPAPYLLIGPPGTGKTVTLAHTIREIFRKEKCNILVCAPSNSATDRICETILDVCLISTRKVYRLYPLMFPVESIPPKIKMFANLDPVENVLWIPNRRKLMNYNILVTTLQTVGRLVSAKVPSHHFKYIFVDEAGQATEPECLIPVAGLVEPLKGQVVLAGDPKQLGPVVKSWVAQKHGLGLSLLERLARDFPVYKPEKGSSYEHRFVTTLTRNYRSHPAIMKISNELFYDGALRSHACLEDSLYNTWEQLPEKDFPVIFHGVAGIDEHESQSTSVFNMAEVEVLMEYLKSLVSHLYKNGVESIGPGEIGIIAPYRKQVGKIRKALKTDNDLIMYNLENILVGTVEKFQGREFDVILVSAVRSNPKLTDAKQNYTLGFVSDKKRFNVTMTRARSVMIVLGDPRLLETDPIWKKLIHYCIRNNACRGIPADAKDDKPTTPPISCRGKGCSSSSTLVEDSTSSFL